jgi:hypothetical protein
MKFLSTAYVLRLVGLAVVIGALLAVTGASSTSAASPQFGPVIEFWDGNSWTPQASPNPGGSAEFSAIAAISASDVWAVGAYGRLILPSGGGSALAEHWDGSSWQQVPMPTPSGADEVHLYGAAATSASDVWAVGSWAGPGGRSYEGEGEYSTLIEHWDGSAWAILPSPPQRGTAQLYGVTALSPTNAWAVGYYGKHVGLNRALVLHWDGSTWKQMATPHPGCHSYSSLSGVAAVSPRSVWAVGSYCRPALGAGNHSSNQTLTLHWNGKSWTQVRSPNFRVSGGLSAVAAVGRNNVWAVGGYRNGHGSKALVAQWTGRSWRVVPAHVGTAAEGLNSLAMIAGNDIWATGTYDIGNDQTLTEHWDGNAWSLVPSPNPAVDESNHLSAIAAASLTAVWAVGCFYLGD